jgi:hypothetical protein
MREISPSMFLRKGCLASISRSGIEVAIASNSLWSSGFGSSRFKGSDRAFKPSSRGSGGHIRESSVLNSAASVGGCCSFGSDLVGLTFATVSVAVDAFVEVLGAAAEHLSAVVQHTSATWIRCLYANYLTFVNLEAWNRTAIKHIENARSALQSVQLCSRLQLTTAFYQQDSDTLQVYLCRHHITRRFPFCLCWPS